MRTLTKVGLGLVGKLRPRPPKGDPRTRIVLPPPEKHGGLPLLDALAQRRSTRAFAPTPLPLPLLSSLLWCAWGVNRPHGERTAPSAMDCQEIDLYAALPAGAYRYDAAAHALNLAVANDVRPLTGYQDFVDDAPLDLVYVVDRARMQLVPASQRERFAAVAVGAIAQNVYLFAANSGLGTVLRALVDRAALTAALGLGPHQAVLMAQTVGFPRP